MIDYRKLDGLMDQLLGVIPDSARYLQHDLESNLRAVLEEGLRKMNLVSREEFDVQSALLARLQLRYQQLELQIANLEKQKTPH
jgi:ubiquinone biosynthesis accessory factor UbiK